MMHRNGTPTRGGVRGSTGGAGRGRWAGGRLASLAAAVAVAAGFVAVAPASGALAAGRAAVRAVAARIPSIYYPPAGGVVDGSSLLNVRGRDFPARTAVVVRIAGLPGASTNATTAATGALDTSLVLSQPTGDLPRDTALEVAAKADGKVLARIPVRVVAHDRKGAARLTSPRDGATVVMRSVVTIAGRGCVPGRSVKVMFQRMSDPNSRDYPAVTGTAAADGTFRVAVRVPDVRGIDRPGADGRYFLDLGLSCETDTPYMTNFRLVPPAGGSATTKSTTPKSTTSTTGDSPEETTAPVMPAPGTSGTATATAATGPTTTPTAQATPVSPLAIAPADNAPAKATSRPSPLLPVALFSVAGLAAFAAAGLALARRRH